MEYLRYFFNWITGKAEKDAMNRVIEGNNYFSFQFYQGLAKEKKHGGNILIAAAPLQIVVAMLWVGCSEEARQQIQDAMQLPADRDTIVYGFKALLNQLLTLRFTIMNIATRIYTPGHVFLKKDFYVTCGRHFEVKLKPTEFHSDEGRIRDSVNMWVKKNTMNKVDLIIRRQRLDDATQLLLVNGVNFECRMSVPFLACDSTSDKFYVSSKDVRTVTFLNQTGIYRCGEIQELQARVLELKYKSPTLSLLMMLPFTSEGLSEMESKLPNVRVLDLLERTVTQRVQTSIPKFRLLEGYDASDHFYDVNLDSLIDMQSNALEEVSEAKPPLTVTHLWQKTYFEFIEEGDDLESSGVVRLPEDPRVSTMVFRADHPFVFMVVDRESGLIILLGRVTCKDRFDMSMLRSESGSKLVIPDMNRGSWVADRNRQSPATSSTARQEWTLPATSQDDVKTGRTSPPPDYDQACQDTLKLSSTETKPVPSKSDRSETKPDKSQTQVQIEMNPMLSKSSESKQAMTNLSTPEQQQKEFTSETRLSCDNPAELKSTSLEVTIHTSDEPSDVVLIP